MMLLEAVLVLMYD